MNNPGLLEATSRRDFLKTTGKAAAAAYALSGVALPPVHAQGSDQIKIVLIGCGGRGGGAAKNALSVNKGGAKLVAMADVFENKLNTAFTSLKRDREVGGDVEVDDGNKFLGFDAYKKAMDQLRKGDVAIFTTPLAFRWVHFQYAIEKGLNVFMEKPLTCDGPGSRRMLALADDSVKKNLKVGVGLMSRHSRHMQQLHQRIQDGEIGDLLLMRGYRMQGGSGSCIPRQLDRRGKELTEVMFQISRFHSFLWLSGGAFNDFYIHHIDHLCWMKNAWPVKAQGVGGRHYKKNAGGIEYVDQNFDAYAVEYTFADGTKMYMDGRGIPGAQPVYNSWAHGTKGIAVVARANDCTGPSSTYKGQNATAENRLWQSEVKREENDPYKNEWVALLDAIRNNKPHNEVKRGVEASIVSNMGRMATHTGQEITFDEALNHEHEYSPNTDKITADGPSPLMPDANGRYPKPEPGQIKNREYSETVV
ncbi:MAG TPA: twin-arginine translocation signal domain-containing protein [Verrucomicrobiae bacterium]|jgi:predicted dehydrogenase|nr:twin-arginine translocation signal domain-containing protein [Verrucomicrobiae bacterium]